MEDGKVIGPQDYCFSETRNESTGEPISTNVLLCFYEDTDVRLVVYPIGEWKFLGEFSHKMILSSVKVLIWALTSGVEA